MQKFAGSTPYAEMSSSLATALSPKVRIRESGGDRQTVATNRSIRDLAEEMTGLSKQELDELLNLMSVTSNIN